MSGSKFRVRDSKVIDLLLFDCIDAALGVNKISLLPALGET